VLRITPPGGRGGGASSSREAPGGVGAAAAPQPGLWRHSMRPLPLSASTVILMAEGWGLALLGVLPAAEVGCPRPVTGARGVQRAGARAPGARAALPGCGRPG